MKLSKKWSVVVLLWLMVTGILLMTVGLSIGTASLASADQAPQSTKQSKCPEGTKERTGPPRSLLELPEFKDAIWCSATPSSVVVDGPLNHRTPPGLRDHLLSGLTDVEYPPLGYSFIWAKTGTYYSGGPEATGVKGSIQASDPVFPVVNPGNDESQFQHVVNSFFAQDYKTLFDSDYSIESGWINCNWHSDCYDDPVPFLAVKQNGGSQQAYFYDNLPLTPGNHYAFMVWHVGNDEWQATVEYPQPGFWIVLEDDSSNDRFDMEFSEAPVIWQNWEVYDASKVIPAAPSYEVPDSEFGGNPNRRVQLNLTPTPGQNWENWDTDIVTSEKNCSTNGKYCISWYDKYYHWKGYYIN